LQLALLRYRILSHLQRLRQHCYLLGEVLLLLPQCNHLRFRLL
jgi:hypothetical protein